MTEALIVAVILYGVIALMIAISRIVEYSIFEDNLLRTIAKVAAALIWPVFSARAIRKWFTNYLETRFAQEWRELFPAKPEVDGISPPKVTVADLANTGSTYKPGQWVS